jgi:hypothetical protein
MYLHYVYNIHYVRYKAEKVVGKQLVEFKTWKDALNVNGGKSRVTAAGLLIQRTSFWYPLAEISLPKRPGRMVSSTRNQGPGERQSKNDLRPSRSLGTANQNLPPLSHFLDLTPMAIWVFGKCFHFSHRRCGAMRKIVLFSTFSGLIPSGNYSRCPFLAESITYRLF